MYEPARIRKMPANCTAVIVSPRNINARIATNTGPKLRSGDACEISICLRLFATRRNATLPKIDTPNMRR